MTLEEKLQQVRKDMCSSLSNKVIQESSKASDVCPVCGGTEWILETMDGIEQAVPCKCREKNKMKRRMSFAEIPEAFKGMRLNTFRTSVYREPDSKAKINIACKMIKEYMGMFEDAKRNGMGLYLYSKSKGSGKTRMAASLANEIMEKHDTGVKFATSLNILAEIRRTFDSNSQYTESQLLDALVMAEVLIIDDFGTEKATAWVRDKFYQIINSRYVEKKITIFTSNEPINGLDYDDRITNRIKECCYQIDFPEESVREYIYEENMREIIERIGG